MRSTVFLLSCVAMLIFDSPSQVKAADHREAPSLLLRGQLDLNDLYAFRSPGNADNTVLILTVNPFAGNLSPTTFGTVATGVAYEFQIDNNGDAVPDVTYSTTFTGNGPAQGFSITRTDFQGTTNVVSGNTGVVSAFNGGAAAAGLFDDPFFFDSVGFGNGFTTPPIDRFAGANVSAIVLEIPSVQLGNVLVGIQGRTTEIGVQVDRVGRPAIATALIPAGQRREDFNAGTPNNDRNDFGADVVTSITSLGNGANAAGLRDFLLPDLLTFDSSSAAGFLNGRRLQDDVIDAALQTLTGNPLVSDGIDANDMPFSGVFPYLAPIHVQAVPEPSSTLLIAGCVAGIAGVRRWRKRSEPTA